MVFTSKWSKYIMKGNYILAFWLPMATLASTPNSFSLCSKIEKKYINYIFLNWNYSMDKSLFAKTKKLITDLFLILRKKETHLKITLI